MLMIGDQAPDVTAPDAKGTPIRLADFRDDKVVVLYFYPKDETPGCTMEACGFRDHYTAFVSAGAVVIGVSADSSESHARFIDRHSLPFILLSDRRNELRKAFRVPKSLGFMPGRTTFVIDKRGVIQHVFNSQIRARQHVTEALTVVRRLA